MAITYAEIDRYIERFLLGLNKPDNRADQKHSYLTSNGVCQICILDEIGHNERQKRIANHGRSRT